MNYDEMPAGPEMDRLVAEKVMGWIIGEDKCDLYEWNGRLWTEPMWDEDAIIWRPSNRIEQAWQVVEKMPGFTLEVNGYHYWCKIHVAGTEPQTADTAPLAICRAALKAIRP